MKVYFNEKGHIKNVVYDNVTATSHYSEKIEAIADFDTLNYTVTIDILRADGMMLGRYPMLPVVENDEVHHEYVFTKDDVAIPGPAQMTIRYEIYQENDEGELEVVYSNPMGLIIMQIYEAVDISSDKYQIIDRRFFENELKIQTNKTSIENLELNKVEVPTKTSDLSNDSGFITQDDIPAIPVNFSDLVDDIGYAKTADIPTVPTNLSQLNNDSGFITNAVIDLLNYYKKSETYTKDEVNTLIATIQSLDIRVVETLPTENISTSSIYFVLRTSGETNNIFDEYIYCLGEWEKIGSTDIDLSDYVKTTDLPTNFSDLTDDIGYAKTADIPTVPTNLSQLNNDSGFITNAVIDLLNYYKKSETYTKDEVNTLIATIQSLDIRVVETLPTENISTSSIYFVLRTSGETNNIFDEYIYCLGEWEKIGSTDIDLSDYVKTTDLPTNFSDLTDDIGYAKAEVIPTKTSDLSNDSGFITQDDIPAIPVNFSDLTDDVGYAKAVDMPTKASDINALSNATRYGYFLSTSYDATTGIITTTLRDQTTAILSTATVDLPLELLISTYGSYYDNGIIYLRLANGEYITVDVAELIDSYTADGTTIVMTNRKFQLSSAYKDLIDNAVTQIQFDTLESTLDDLNSDISGLQSSKVDVQTGKGLSTEDYTTEEKTKLSELVNLTIEIDDDVEVA